MSELTEPLATESALSPAPAIALRDIFRRVAGASAIYGLANFGIRALNFLLLPVYTRYLAPTDYGMITLAETLAAFLALIFSLGFDTSIQRLYFQHLGETEALNSYLGSALKFALAMTALAAVLAFTVGAPLLHATAPRFDVPYRYVAWAITTAIAAQFLQYVLILYQSQGRARSYAVLSVVSFVLTAGFALSLVVLAGRGASGMLLGKLAASIIGFAIAIAIVWKPLQARFHWQYVRETLAVGVPLVPHQLMAGGLMAADRFILSHYRDLRDVGLYAIAYTFGGVMSLVTMSLSQAWAPVYYDLARQGEEGRRALGRICSELTVVLSAIACLGALIAQDFIAHFLDGRYAAAGRVVPWIIGAYLAHSIFTVFSLAVMQAKRTRWLMGVSFVALTLNTVLNFALIPRWGMYGAAYATAAAYVIEAVVMYGVSQRAYPLVYDLRRIFAASGVFLLVLAVTQLHLPSPQRQFALLATGLVCIGLLSALGLKHAVVLLRNRRAVVESR